MIISKRSAFVAVLFAAMSSFAGVLDNPRVVFEHFPNVNVDAHVYRIAQKYSLGGVSGNRFRSIDWDRATPREMALWFRETLNVWVGEGQPVKMWRASNLIDMWTWHRFRTDAFWISTRLGERGKEMNPLICGLMRVESYEVLKAVCEEDDCARDLIIGIGLVCQDLPTAKMVAMELAPQSEVNWPVYALRIPIEEARKLLGGREEYARLLSNLEIRAMKPGLARYNAIMQHISRFPDYTEAEMPRTSIALNTFAELGAVAGGDLANAGRFKEAMEVWLTHGGCPEDVALVSEQILDEDELKRFIDRYPWNPSLAERGELRDMCSINCTFCYGRERYLFINSAEEMRAYIRTIYAKRLMRAGRYNDAIEYFHRAEDRELAKRYQQLRREFNGADQEAPTSRMVFCGLTLGALMRDGADELFGTELEPDNMICDGRYPCRWAVDNKAVASVRKIPEENRFHYRWRTADVYKRTGDLAGKAVGLEDRRRLQGFCYWVCGLLLRYSDPATAFVGYDFVRRETPELVATFTRENWEGKKITAESYQVAPKAPSPYKEWLDKNDWINAK